MSLKFPPPYPLKWPKGKARFKGERKTGSFRRDGRESKKVISEELWRLGSKHFQITANVTELSTRQPPDPGVAVWFDYKELLHSVAVDRYASVQANIAAIAASLEALRTLERHGGVELFDQAMQGFVADALPARGGSSRLETPSSWWSILGVAEDAPLDVCEAAYRALARSAHPDAGGSADKMAGLNAAIAEARKSRDVSS